MKISVMVRMVIVKSFYIILIGIILISQRQGVVLINKDKKVFFGLFNIDNRGCEWESGIELKDEVYQ